MGINADAALSSEVQAILAAQVPDIDEVERVVATMLPADRRLLVEACYRVIEACHWANGVGVVKP